MTRGLDATGLSAPIVVDHVRLAESDEPGTTTEAGLMPRWSLNLCVHRLGVTSTSCTASSTAVFARP